MGEQKAMEKATKKEKLIHVLNFFGNIFVRSDVPSTIALNTRKKIDISKNNTKLLILIVVMMLSFIVPSIYAADDTLENANLLQKTNEAMKDTPNNGVERGHQDNTDQVDQLRAFLSLTPSVLPKQQGTKFFFDMATEALTNEKYADLFQKPFKAMKAVGFMLSISIALSHLAMRIENGQDTPESVLKTLVEIGMTGLIIMNLADILKAIIDLGLLFINWFSPEGVASSITTEQAESFFESWTGNKTGSLLWRSELDQMLASNGSMMNKLVDFGSGTILYATTLEIIIRQIFAPLAVADVYQDGFRSSGARYLKGLFACLLKLAICGFIMMVFIELDSLQITSKVMQTLQEQMNADNAMGSFKLTTAAILILKGSMTMLMFQSGQLAKEIVGAS